MGHYTVVLTSTCQQSASTGMAALKEEQLVFDSVIVDEAARANPLDLFTPLVLGRRRIVLVGDHDGCRTRLDPDVERQLEESVSTQTREALKKSLFERLFHSLRERRAWMAFPGWWRSTPSTGCTRCWETGAAPPSAGLPGRAPVRALPGVIQGPVARFRGGPAEA